MKARARPPLSRLERTSLLLSLALTALLLLPLRHYLTDDTFIHLQYARRLADGQGLVFNPGERVYGCTSPLWAALIANGMALKLDGLATARALGVLAALGSVLLFFRLARNTLRTPELRSLATIAWAGHAWMLRWSASGMETPLAVALVLAGFVAFTDSREWGARPLRTGALWGLAALARPEAVFLLALWIVVLIADTENRAALPRLISGAVPPLAIYGGWLAFAWGYYGTPWPRTLAAKTAGALGLEFQLDNLWRQLRIVGATDGVLVALLAIALLFLRPRVPSLRRAAPRLLPWAWLTGLPVLYAARGVPVVSRYLLPLLPVLSMLSWRAAEAWWVGPVARPARRRRAAWLGIAVASLVLLQNLAVYRFEVVPHVRSFSAGFERSLVYWGRWLGAHTEPGAVIAAPDIGAIGYYSGRRIVDLAGLVSPRMIPLLESEPEEDVVKELRFESFARPDFLVDRAPAPNDLLHRSRFKDCLTSLGHASVPNLGIARPGEAVYTFYRVDWGCVDALRARR